MQKTAIVNTLLLAEERRHRILEVLHQSGKVVATQISQTLGVSEDTVRRDLREMEDAGLLVRVHGGALPVNSKVVSFARRAEQTTKAKRAIGAAAARLVKPGQVIIVDGGTTALEAARQLPLELRATVVTHSPPVAVALGQHVNLEVVLVGGRLLKELQVAVGAQTVAAFAEIRADWCFLGTCSLHPEAGLGASNLEEAYVRRAMIAGAAQTVALATADKLNSLTPYTLCPLSDLNLIITDAKTDLSAYEMLGLKVKRV
jgi:DeoR/GlpR family transcriptional regulator of sugar metabolism